MSEDSSNNPTVQQHRPLPNWLVAFLALSATIVGYYASLTIGGLVVGIFPALHHWSGTQTDLWLTNSVEAQFAYGFIAYGLLVAGIVLMLQWFHWNWATIGLTKPKFIHLAVGFLAAAPYYLLYLAIVLAIGMLIPSLNVSQRQDIGFDSVHGLVPMVLTFISLVVLPPLAEEIAMRGFLYTGLKKWLPKIVAGLAVSLLFGAAHLAEGGDAGPLWIGAIDTFTLSLVLVFLREKTGNLWAGIVLHATKNCVAFVALFIIGGR